MNSIEKKIKEILEEKEATILSQETVEELGHRISVYHEELVYQNDELTKTNNKLSETNDRLTTLFQHAPVPYLITDDNGNCLDWNILFH